ncbi:MAG: TldD/PmbA family protein [Rhodospirillales bacterium]|nr:TldD/PmbA family protein [Rhodospirillales bacterium]
MDTKQRLAADAASVSSPRPGPRLVALDLLDRLLAAARQSGADAADAVFADRRSLSVACRLGSRESLERSESAVVGLRVFVGHRQAIVSSSDLGKDALAEMVSRAVSMARVVPEDPFCGLADPAEVGQGEATDVDACESDEIDATAANDRALAAEAAALAIPGVSNSEGAEAGCGYDAFAIAATNGFRRAYERSWNNVSVSVLAGEGTAMERDYAYSSAVYRGDLEDAATLGRRCGERAVRRLRPRKAGSAQVPVIFEPRVAGSILGHLSSAINGASVARGTTFLGDKLGERLFAPTIRVIDDPLRRRGLRSRPFDGEGIASQPHAVIDGGVLTTWFLDLRSARQLGLRSTGHASRGASSPPSPSATNLYLEPGPLSPEALIADIRSGLYVTDLMGFGVNGVTGDYSRGASGFWIENGEIAYPVSEITISGHLLSMFAALTPASDLVFRYGTDSPTVRIDGMTVAGR